MNPPIKDIIEEIKETAKGSDNERINRLELGMQELKRRFDRVERKIGRHDDE